MGIKGLKNIIKKHAPDSFDQLNIWKLRGSRVCIDSSILLYRYRYIYDTDNFHILGFLCKAIELLENKITPIFVFDGKPPDAKKETIESRVDIRKKNEQRIKELKEKIGNVPMTDSEFINSDGEEPEPNNQENVQLMKELNTLEKNHLVIKRSHSLEVIELLKTINVEYIVAESEAEKCCAMLQKNGLVDYVLTDDTDSLTFGANKVIFNNYILCDLTIVLSGLGLTYSQFVDFCILCGCDYTCTIPKIGPATALNIIKKNGTLDSFLEQNTKYVIPENFDYILARRLFLEDEPLQTPLKSGKDPVKLNEILQKNKINTSLSSKVNKLI
jgi:flap endonuclease-1